MDLQNSLFRLVLFIPAFVAALTVHEFAHAWAGNRLGDDTARSQGRLSLDPLVHLDPFGCIVMVFAILGGLPLIGWAKPVPFNPRNLEDPRKGGMLIALAGPISNLMQMPIWLGGLWLLHFVAQRSDPDFAINVYRTLSGQPDMNNLFAIFGAVLATGVVVNIGLAVFNMIPIPPLDGHWVLEALGPPAVSDFFDMIRPWSFFILYGLLWMGVIRMIMGPIMDLAYRIVFFAM